nr:immunoglobulin heavy chain junction region [Mus musculus]NSM07805.1 immunoglobulin heavy chain junction region [Mus musculus]
CARDYSNNVRFWYFDVW